MRGLYFRCPGNKKVSGQYTMTRILYLDYLITITAIQRLLIQLTDQQISP